MGRKFAAADIGSNTAHVLIAEVDGTRLRRLANLSEWLSLGEIVGRTGTIPKDLESRLTEVLIGYKKVAKEKGAKRIYMFATEAVRRAKGHEEVIARISGRLGLEIDVISPEREAELALKGAMIDMPTSRPSHFIEVGGGSAQVAYLEEGEIVRECSLPIGTGVLAARHGITHPVDKSVVSAIEAQVIEESKALKGFPTSERLVVSGGVARGIWRALHPDGDPNLSLRELEYIAWASRRLNVGQIERRFRVKEKRAETILTGAIVYKTLMGQLQHKTMRVSLFGVREGAALLMGSGAIDGSEL